MVYCQTKCDRCGIIVDFMFSDSINDPFIHKVHMSTLTVAGKQCDDIKDLEFYICADCWNNLIDFKDKGGQHEKT